MQEIWEYTLVTTGDQQLKMPEGAELLTVQIQAGKPCLWALVNPTAEKVVRHIEIFGTGNPIPDGNREYIATYQLHSGALIFHVFELFYWDWK